MGNLQSLLAVVRIPSTPTRFSRLAPPPLPTHCPTVSSRALWQVPLLAVAVDGAQSKPAHGVQSARNDGGFGGDAALKTFRDLEQLQRGDTLAEGDC